MMKHSLTGLAFFSQIQIFMIGLNIP
jgi:hypothetical protein